jgi:hypothetical protein
MVCSMHVDTLMHAPLSFFLKLACTTLELTISPINCPRRQQAMEAPNVVISPKSGVGLSVAQNEITPSTPLPSQIDPLHFIPCPVVSSSNPEPLPPWSSGWCSLPPAAGHPNIAARRIRRHPTTRTPSPYHFPHSLSPAPGRRAAGGFLHPGHQSAPARASTSMELGGVAALSIPDCQRP